MPHNGGFKKNRIEKKAGRVALAHKGKPLVYRDLRGRRSIAHDIGTEGNPLLGGYPDKAGRRTSVAAWAAAWAAAESAERKWQAEWLKRYRVK